jgi:hypothetical protein
MSLSIPLRLQKIAGCRPIAKRTPNPKETTTIPHIWQKSLYMVYVTFNLTYNLAVRCKIVDSSMNM